MDFPSFFTPFPMAFPIEITETSPGCHRRGGGVGLESSACAHLQEGGAQDQQAPEGCGGRNHIDHHPEVENE